MPPEIKFGTDGWRGIIADDFTFENVRRVSRAVASFAKKNEADGLRQGKGIVVGYDTRFASRRSAEIVAETISGCGIPVTLSNHHIPMHGAGRGILAGIFQKNGIDHVEVHGNVDPLFPGINPEPIEPHISLLEETVRAQKCHAGFATDGDADRIGACDEHGAFVDSHKIFSILLRWLLERRGWPGDVVKTFSATQMLNRIAEKHGRKLHETPIGFKYVCDIMLEREVLIGGEESGGIGIARHLPERDGTLNALLLAAVMAEEGKTLAHLVESLQQDFGQHHYGRRDLHVSTEIKDGTVRRAATGEIGDIA